LLTLLLSFSLLSCFVNDSDTKREYKYKAVIAAAAGGTTVSSLLHSHSYFLPCVMLVRLPAANVHIHKIRKRDDENDDGGMMMISAEATVTTIMRRENGPNVTFLKRRIEKIERKH
jgi:hypothetical protein